MNFFEYLQQEQEDQEIENFKYFMIGFEGGLIFDLNKAYADGDMEEYNRQVSNIKEKGIRVFRNSKGEHKVKFV